METPNYLKALLTPNTKKPQGRKVWSIDLETVWLPFFTATNAMGDSAIPSASLGCPMRLAYDKAFAVRFSSNGRPIIRVDKELSNSVKMVRDNFTANLVSYAGDVMTHHSEDYKAQIELAVKAGVPIAQHDREELTKALQAQAEAEKAKENVIAQAQAVVEAKAEAKPKRKPSQKRKPESKSETEAEKAETIKETKEPELVAVS